MKSDWQNKHVAILGLGMEGLSTAKFLKDKGAHLVVLDRKGKDEMSPSYVKTLDTLGVQWVLGSQYLDDLTSYDVVIRTPGIPYTHRKLQEAILHGVSVTSHTKLFFDLCPGEIIGVTGTKGKGTTASLIYEMLRSSGKDVFLGGNIGTPPLDFLPQLTKDSIVVLELSSFQLQDMDKSPHIAVMLMVTSEHLDYHKDIDEYINAKRNLLRHQLPSDIAILNRDYPVTNESDILTEGKVLFVSREREVDEGCFLRNNAIWTKLAGSEQKIIDTADILLPGRHNLENVCAAVLAASLAGASQKALVSVLRSFKGLVHRLQLVRTVNNVRYYDDSFSTTPETAIAAIQAFKAPEILILGGSSKGSDFTGLGKVIREAENIKAIIGIGDEWEEIKSKIKNQRSKILMVEGATSMQQVVQAAAKIASPGDVVLLSPACASFGMFQNYKERGDKFQHEVNLL